MSLNVFSVVCATMALSLMLLMCSSVTVASSVPGVDVTKFSTKSPVKYSALSTSYLYLQTAADGSSEESVILNPWDFSNPVVQKAPLLSGFQTMGASSKEGSSFIVSTNYIPFETPQVAGVTLYRVDTTSHVAIEAFTKKVATTGFSYTVMSDDGEYFAWSVNSSVSLFSSASSTPKYTVDRASLGFAEGFWIVDGINYSPTKAGTTEPYVYASLLPPPLAPGLNSIVTAVISSTGRVASEINPISPYNGRKGNYHIIFGTGAKLGTIAQLVSLPPHVFTTPVQHGYFEIPGMKCDSYTTAISAEAKYAAIGCSETISKTSGKLSLWMINLNTQSVVWTRSFFTPSYVATNAPFFQDTDFDQQSGYLAATVQPSNDGGGYVYLFSVESAAVLFTETVGGSSNVDLVSSLDSPNTLVLVAHPTPYPTSKDVSSLVARISVDTSLIPHETSAATPNPPQVTPGRVRGHSAQTNPGIIDNNAGNVISLKHNE